MNNTQIFILYSEEKAATCYGFGYLVYEKKIEIESRPIFSPKLFSYLSQYPYFNTFNNISKQLVTILEKEDRVFL